MHPHLVAEVDSEGHVFVSVPAESLWEFVEYVSFQRLNSHYHYGTTHFTVVFPNQDPETIQRLLNDWASSLAHEPGDASLA